MEQNTQEDVKAHLMQTSEKYRELTENSTVSINGRWKRSKQRPR